MATGEQPFPGAVDGVIIFNVVTGERPVRPPGSDKWVSDDVWNFVSRCWSPSWDGRPDVNFAINALNDAAHAVEVIRRKAYTTATDQGEGTSRRGTGVSRTSNTDHERRLMIVINRRSPAAS